MQCTNEKSSDVVQDGSAMNEGFIDGHQVEVVNRYDDKNPNHQYPPRPSPHFQPGVPSCCDSGEWSIDGDRDVPGYLSNDFIPTSILDSYEIRTDDDSLFYIRLFSEVDPASVDEWLSSIDISLPLSIDFLVSSFLNFVCMSHSYKVNPDGVHLIECNFKSKYLLPFYSNNIRIVLTDPDRVFFGINDIVYNFDHAISNFICFVLDCSVCFSISYSNSLVNINKIEEFVSPFQLNDLNESAIPTIRFPNGPTNGAITDGDGSVVESLANVTAIIDNRDNDSSGDLGVVTGSSVPYGMEPAYIADLNDRWIDLDTFTWTAVQTSGEIINQYELPYAIYHLVNSNPALVFMNNYYGIRPQLTIRVLVNSTQFHTGLLSIGFRYLGDYVRFDEKPYIASAFQIPQLNSIYIQASMSNTGELEIPFVSPLQVLPIRPSSMSFASNYVSLVVGVIDPLRIGDGGSTSVTCMLQVKFNIRNQQTAFFGVTNRIPIISPQGPSIKSLAGSVVKAGVGAAMQTMGAPVASVVKTMENLVGGVGAVMRAFSFDAPLDTRNPDPVAVFPGQPLSSGEGAVLTRNMRLNRYTQSPQDSGIFPSNFKVALCSDITQVFGLVSHVTFSVDNVPQALITDVNLSPIDYISNPQGGVVMTPSAWVAMNFAYWSGSLEYKVIFIKARPQSFRVRFSYDTMSNPNYYSDPTGQPNTIVDVQDQVEFTYTVPMLTALQAHPVTINNSTIPTFGKFSIHLESRISTVPTCSDFVSVIVLQRISSDSQFLCPIPHPRLTPQELPVPFFTNSLTTDMYADNNILRVVTVNDQTLRYLVPVTGVLNIPFLNDGVYYIGIKANNNRWYYGSCEGQVPPGNVIWNVVTWDCIIEGIPPLFTNSCHQHFYLCQHLEYNIVPMPALLIPQSPISVEENVAGVEGSRTTPQTVIDNSPVRKFNSIDLIQGETNELCQALKRFETVYTNHKRPVCSPFTARVFYSFPITLGRLDPEDNLRPRGMFDMVAQVCRFYKGSLNYSINISSSHSGIGQVHYIPSSLLVNSPFIWADFYGPLENDSNIPFMNTKYSNVAHEPISINAGVTNIPITVPSSTPANAIVSGIPANDALLGNYLATFNGAIILDITFTIVEPDTPVSMNTTIHRSMGDDGQFYCFQGVPLAAANFLYENYNAVVPFPASREGKSNFSLLPYSLAMSKSVKSIRSVIHSDVMSPQSPISCNSYLDYFDNSSIKCIFYLENNSGLSKYSVVEESPPLSHMVDFLFESMTTRCRRLKFRSVLKKMRGKNLIHPQSPPSEIDALLEGLSKEYKAKTKNGPYLLKIIALNKLSPQRVAAIQTAADDMAWQKQIYMAVAELFPIYNFNFDFHTATQGSSTHLNNVISYLSSFVTGTASYLADKLIRNYGTTAKSGVAAMKGLFSYMGDLIRDPATGFRLLSYIRMMSCASDNWVRAYAFVGLLIDFGLISSLKSIAASTLVCEMFYMLTPRKAYFVFPQSEGLMDDAEGSFKSTATKYAALLVGSVCGLASFSESKTWTKGVEQFIKNLAPATNSWYNLLSKSCDFIMDYVLEVFGYSSPEFFAVAELRNLNVNVNEMTERAIYLTSPQNRNLVMNSPKLQKELSDLNANMGRVVSIIVARGAKSPNFTSFAALYRQVSKTYIEVGCLPDSVSANRSPICIWLSGPRGVGKSTFAKRLAVDLCAYLGISYEGDPTFVRTNRKYWDGYRSQPVILFDDAFQVKTPNVNEQSISDWFGIHTPSPFTPEFSSIEEKKYVVCPQITIVCANSPYPHPNGISDLEAFYRRRDFLIHVDMKQSLRDQRITMVNNLHLTAEQTKNSNHLSFSQYLDPCNDKSGLSAPLTRKEFYATLFPKVASLNTTRLELATDIASRVNTLAYDQIATARAALLEEVQDADFTSHISKAITSMLGDTVTAQGPQLIGYNTYTTPPSVNFCTQHKDDMELINFSDLRDGEHDAVEHCVACGFYTITREPHTYRLAMTPLPEDEALKSFNKIQARVFKNATAVDQALFETKLLITDEDAPNTPAFNFDDIQNQWENIKPFSLWDWIPTTLQIVVMLAVVLYSFISAYQYFLTFLDMIKGKEMPPPTVQRPFEGQKHPTQHFTYTEDTAVYGDLASSGSVQNLRAPARRLGIKGNGPQEDLPRRIRRNFVRFTFERNGSQHNIDGCGMFDRVILTPWHGWAGGVPSSITLQTYTNVVTKVPTNSISLPSDAFTVSRFRDCDLAVVNINYNAFPKFPSLYRSLISQNKFLDTSKTFTFVSMMPDKFPNQTIKVDYIDEPTRYAAEGDMPALDSYLLGFSYPGIAGYGLCGSLVFDARTGLIAGMHTSGTATVGFSSLVCREIFADFLPTDIVEPPVDHSEKPLMEFENGFIPLGKIQGNSAPLVTRTKIAPSICQGVISEPYRLPVNVKTPSESHPGIVKFTKAVNKGSNPPKLFPLKDVDVVVNSLSDNLNSLCPPLTQTPRVRSIEEALVGVEGLPFAVSLRRNTSVGYPLNVSGRGTKKSDHVSYKTENGRLRVTGISPELNKLIVDNHAIRKSGGIPCDIFQNFMKDERLKPGKNPRLINGCPLEMIIEFRRYCMDFFSALKHSGDKIGVMIGLNIHGPDWSMFVKRMLSKSSKFRCGDYTDFGPTLSPELVIRCGEMIINWYNTHSPPDFNRAEHATVVRALFYNIAFSTQLSMDTLVQTFCGSPSGNPYTADINSLVNIMYLMLGWIDCFRDTTLEDINLFWKMTSIGVYGDDLIFTVVEYASQFDNVSLQRFFSKYGITYTDSKKNLEIEPYCDIDTASFLKCSILPHPTRPGEYQAALEKKVLEDICNWINLPCNSEADASFENSVACAELAYAWGHQYYDEIVTILSDYWRHHDRNFDPRSWDYLDRLFWNELEVIPLPMYLDPLTRSFCP